MDDFAESIRDMVDDGWQPLGAVVIIPWLSDGSTEGVTFYQTMVQYGE